MAGALATCGGSGSSRQPHLRPLEAGRREAAKGRVERSAPEVAEAQREALDIAEVLGRILLVLLWMGVKAIVKAIPRATPQRASRTGDSAQDCLPGRREGTLSRVGAA